MRVLILGGSGEASALARRLAGEPGIEATLSLAGRTSAPAPPPIPFRVGGFGGIEGLRAYLAAEPIAAVVDATHPFAARISAHALAACGDIPLLRLTRPQWQRQPGDDWREVDTAAEAVEALGRPPARVFLTHGRLELDVFAQAPQHFYLLRTIEPPEHLEKLPQHRLILARGPFALEDELGLMQVERMEVLVSKNSGGAATYAKIEAARLLGLRVVMLKRPAGTEGAVHDVEAAMAWLRARRG